MVEVTANFRLDDINMGETGVMPRCCYRSSVYPTFTAEVFAHDMIEHINGVDAIGTVEDELEALGVVLWIRGLAGELDKGIHNRYENIAHDLDSLFEVTSLCPDNEDFGKTMRLIERPDEETQVDDEIDQAILAFNDESEGKEEFSEIARAYMELGAVKAKRKYGHWNTAWALFDNAKSAFEEVKERLFDEFEAYKGAEFTVRVTPGEFEVSGAIFDELEEFEEPEDD